MGSAGLSGYARDRAGKVSTVVSIAMALARSGRCDEALARIDASWGWETDRLARSQICQARAYVLLKMGCSDDATLCLERGLVEQNAVVGSTDLTSPRASLARRRVFHMKDDQSQSGSDEGRMRPLQGGPALPPLGPRLTRFRAAVEELARRVDETTVSKAD